MKSQNNNKSYTENKSLNNGNTAGGSTTNSIHLGTGKPDDWVT